MNEQIIRIIKQGEGLTTEFKECTGRLSKTVYETVCAFLNTKGGDILLGVKDDGTITGIKKEKAEEIIQDFVTTVNNETKLSPAFSLSINETTIDGKVILHIFVPEASLVHRCDSRIFIRNNSGDFDITNKHQEVSNLYFRKQTTYTENRVFPYAEMADLRKDLFKRVRRIVTIENAAHPWRRMSDLELLKACSLFQKDPVTGQEGITLAGILLFGKDQLVAAAAPAFRVDMLKRVIDTDRYDDRLDLRTNIIEAVDKAMQFVEKHLPTPFYMEGIQSMNLRNIIFREVIINMLIHKEYMGAEPTRFIIERDRVYTENSNKPFINGVINISNLVPHPKNPNIARFFRIIGQAEELGSGFRKVYQYCKAYCGSDPVITDDNAYFRFILPVSFFSGTPQVTPQDSDQDTTQVSDRISEQVSDQVTPQVTPPSYPPSYPPR
ncbi:ATP-dependent DNA helicase RecG [Spirochaetia bacterium]|nr:ATP-dependent DNA helicase RecG [Spirochaetia bacterium]